MTNKIEIEVFKEKIHQIVDDDQEFEILATGFEFIEGPIWNHQEHHLTFSDVEASKIYRWSLDERKTILVDPSNKANGNAYDREGRIVTCEHDTSVVSRMGIDGKGREVLVSKYKGKELNSPNDIVVKSDGSIYFTDPNYGRSVARVGILREQELDFQGVFRYEPKIDKLTLLVDDFENPNGLCFSPDEKKLYVNDTPRSHIREFDVKSDGTVVNSRVFAITKGKGPGLPDGLKVDSHGNVYCTAQGGLHIFDKEGQYIAIIKTPEKLANFTWGDSDLCSLYLTATTTLYRIRVKIPGLKL